MKRILVLIICLMLVISGCTQHHYPPPSIPTPTPTPTPPAPTPPTPTPTKHTQILKTLENHILSGGHWNYSVYPIKPGKEALISWRADCSLNVYILTETQYAYYKDYGFTSRYIAYQKGQRGTLNTLIEDSDRYYFVLRNPLMFSACKIYRAEIKVTWVE